MNESQAIPAPVYEKHVGLSDAIGNIDSVIGHAENIIEKINGNPVGVEQPRESTEQSLHSVLSGGEDEVRGKIDKLHSCLNEIENLLF